MVPEGQELISGGRGGSREGISLRDHILQHRHKAQDMNCKEGEAPHTQSLSFVECFLQRGSTPEGPMSSPNSPASEGPGVQIDEPVWDVSHSNLHVLLPGL